MNFLYSYVNTQFCQDKFAANLAYKLVFLHSFCMSKVIIPAPFAQSTYGVHTADAYKHILKVKMPNEIQSAIYSSNQFSKHCTILDPVKFELLPDSKPHIGMYLDSARSMQHNLADTLTNHFDPANQYLVLGGDHTISIGTGLGLSRRLDMSKIGLIWVDAHGDLNTPETSESKCITGYPVAVNTGLGPQELSSAFEGNFIQKVAYIGLRDIDKDEYENLKKIDARVYNNIDVEMLGIQKVVRGCLKHMQDCTHIWLSIDIDSLDPIYFDSGETDVPVTGGLTPRELLTITNMVQATNTLLITEITQLNSVKKQTPLTVLASRIGETGLGLGGFRYGKNITQD
jgi:arginase